MIVVKLGGSLYNTPELKHWLTALAVYSNDHAIVIVPGGGIFADQVRSAQEIYAFNDETAHHMAIIAMKQFGLLLNALEPLCDIVSTNSPVNSQFSVWLPDDDLLAEPTLLKNWDISSDSIALWLTTKLKAQELLLIKRCSTHTSSIPTLIENNVIDAGFLTLFSQKTAKVKLVHYQEYLSLPEIILSTKYDVRLLHP